MNDTIRAAHIGVKGSIFCTIITLIVGTTTWYIGNSSSKNQLDETIKTLIEVGIIHKYEEPKKLSETLKENIGKLQKENIYLNQENEKLNKKVANRQVNVQYIGSSFIINGIKKNIDSIRPIAIIGDKIYLSKDSVEKIFNEEISIDPQNGLTTIGSNKDNITSLMDICPPYQYHYGKKYSENEYFSMSGHKYNNGFILRAGHVWKGFALINLQNKYSSITFEVGHIDETDMFNKGPKLYAFVDGKAILEKYIAEDRIAQKITIPLNYASELKLQVIDGGGDYGFANLLLAD